MRLVVIDHLTLDGVMQAPGRTDEDTRGGFTHGGWSQPYGDEVMGAVMGERMAHSGGGMLFGRRTYEDLLRYWNTQPDSPFTQALNNTPKYVASMTLKAPLPWPNSTLLGGDLANEVAMLKKKRPKGGGDVAIMGSGTLVQPLTRLGQIDEYMLMIHPLVLGSGRRLFTDDGAFATLQLVDAKPTTKGVIIATYQPTEP